jgi:hypothetical protein
VGHRNWRATTARWGLTIRSSRPHVVASATCYALRLHVAAAPPRVGLTQALGIKGRLWVTKEQFIHRRTEFERRDRRSNTIYLVVFFGVLLAAIPISSHIPEAYDTEFALTFLAFLIANAFIVMWRGRHQAQRAGLVCTSCKGGLLGIPGNIATDTGNCPHCGQRAFAGDA